VRAVTNCRVCGSADLVKYLDLGMLPLANNLATSAQDAIDMERFPMQVLFCQECALSQLSVVIDPDVLFSHYTYRSSINKGYVWHCRDMARSVKELLQIDSGDLVVDGKHLGDAVKKGVLTQIQHGKFVLVGEGKNPPLKLR
jgi:hypothetical protein